MFIWTCGVDIHPDIQARHYSSIPSCNLSSTEETVRIYACPWRSRTCVFTQASSDHPPWPYPVCLWFVLEALLLSLSITNFNCFAIFFARFRVKLAIINFTHLVGEITHLVGKIGPPSVQIFLWISTRALIAFFAVKHNNKFVLTWDIQKMSIGMSIWNQNSGLMFLVRLPGMGQHTHWNTSQKTVAHWLQRTATHCNTRYLVQCKYRVLSFLL